MGNVIEVNGRKIGTGQKVYVVAEVGINHNGDFNTALKLIDEARDSGASAVKLQTYITEKRTPPDSPIFEILKQCELSFDQQDKLFAHAREIGVDIFSTPFDEESVEFLAGQNIPFFKIASFDLVNTQLLRHVARQNQPVMMSRGMANQTEIDTAVEILQEAGVEFVLMHCVSAYPVPSHKSLNLATIRELEERYACPVGFSDHTLGIEAPMYSVAAGATAVEKHFTLSRTADGPDHSFSTEPSEMKQMIEGINHVREMMGEAVWAPIEAEKDILQYRRKS